jgi:hypothetical protein
MCSSEAVDVRVSRKGAKGMKRIRLIPYALVFLGFFA